MKNLLLHRFYSNSSYLAELINGPSFQNFLNRHWITYDNKAIKHKDLTNDHLINIIGHQNHLNHNSYSNINYIALACSRGLTQADLDRFQIPHLNKDGKLCVMDYENNLEIKEVI